MSTCPNLADFMSKLPPSLAQSMPEDQVPEQPAPDRLMCPSDSAALQLIHFATYGNVRLRRSAASTLVVAGDPRHCGSRRWVLLRAEQRTTIRVLCLPATQPLGKERPLTL